MKYYIPLKHSLCLRLLAISLLCASTAHSQITDPIVGDPPRSGLAVGLQTILKFPDSGGKPARLNYFQEAPDGSGRIFICDQRGILYVVVDGEALEYLDLPATVSDFSNDESSGQQGFTYFALHPDFATNGIFFTVHSATKLEANQAGYFRCKRPIIDADGYEADSDHDDVITRWVVTDPTANSFSGTHEEIMRFEQPFRDHNIGQISFNPTSLPGDPDYGMLYIATADGGSDGFPVSDTDPLDDGQDLTVPLGKILRIDPLGTDSTNGKYGIPSDNPFLDSSMPNALGEVWAYGLRNPHRYSWDSAGIHRMYISDIGQWLVEEVNIGYKGANYGWGNREGTWFIDESNEFVLYPLPDDDASYNYTYAVAQYDHPGDPEKPWTGAGAIAGGFVYRGTALPHLVGKYIFADFSNIGKFFYCHDDELIQGEQAPVNELTLYSNGQRRTFLQMVGSTRTDARFGMTSNGDIYVSSKVNGTLYKLVAPPSPATYSLDSSSKRMGPTGGNGSIAITTAGEFADWAFSSLIPDWITIKSGLRGTGDGAVEFSVSQNNGDRQRKYQLVVAGLPYTVVEDVQDSVGMSLDVDAVTLGCQAQTQKLSITSEQSNKVWFAESADEWLTILTGESGEGSGTVQYSVPPNYSETSSRSTTILAAGIAVPVTQEAFDPADFLGGTVVVQGEGWRRSSWFDYFQLYEGLLPWVFHREHGWLYLAGPGGDDHWMYDGQMGWIYTNASIYPWVFSLNQSSWLWYAKDTKSPRWFWHPETGWQDQQSNL